jgi:hypothetical protein
VKIILYVYKGSDALQYKEPGQDRRLDRKSIPNYVLKRILFKFLKKVIVMKGVLPIPISAAFCTKKNELTNPSPKRREYTTNL